MTQLREIAAAIGWEDAATYIQTGNVVFSYDGASSPEQLADGLRAAVSDAAGFEPRIVVVPDAQWRALIDANPFADETNPKCVHAIVFGDNLTSDQAAAVDERVERARSRGSHDSAQVSGRVVYMHTPIGFGKSLLAPMLTGAGGPAHDGTARNWATVVKLADMLGR